MPGMAGVSSRPGCNGPVQAPGHHRVCCGATDSGFGPFSKWVNATRALQAMPAAQAGISESALRDHDAVAIPDGCDVHAL